jgi:hypothetical protein
VRAGSPGKREPKWPARSHLAALAPELDVGIGIAGQEGFGDLNHVDFRRGDTQVVQKGRRDPFIDQNPPVLRVVVELDDVGMAVGSFHQVCLRSSAHLADEAASGNRH